MSATDRPALPRDAFVDWLKREGASRYHDHHRYHVLMHEGKLTKLQLQQWVLNRYYYQTRIPIKDAIIVSKSDDPAFRRMWIHRVRDHDGEKEGEGGLSLWLRLADGVGLDSEEVASCRSVLPGVRFACDNYVQFVQERQRIEVGLDVVGDVEIQPKERRHSEDLADALRRREESPSRFELGDALDPADVGNVGDGGISDPWPSLAGRARVTRARHDSEEAID